MHLHTTCPKVASCPLRDLQKQFSRFVKSSERSISFVTTGKTNMGTSRHADCKYFCLCAPFRETHFVLCRMRTTLYNSRKHAMQRPRRDRLRCNSTTHGKQCENARSIPQQLLLTEYSLLLLMLLLLLWLIMLLNPLQYSCGSSLRVRQLHYYSCGVLLPHNCCERRCEVVGAASSLCLLTVEKAVPNVLRKKKWEI